MNISKYGIHQFEKSISVSLGIDKISRTIHPVPTLRHRICFEIKTGFLPFISKKSVDISINICIITHLYIFMKVGKYAYF